MANITQMRRGQAIRMSGDTHLIVELHHKTPPNLRAFVQVTTKSLSTGKVAQLRMTPNDSVEPVHIERVSYEFSYEDPSGYHFIHPDTYEDVSVEPELIEPIKNYLIENERYELLFADGSVASIDVPASMVMTVAESAEGVKGDSANNVQKPATMETGLIVQVPLFIKPGERIKVKTDDGSYQGRASES